jgi:hypothetical protein
MNDDRVMLFLATHPDRSFTQRETRDATDDVDVYEGDVTTVETGDDDR